MAGAQLLTLTPGAATLETAPSSPPAVPPPALQALEQKMGELKLTSLRFSEQTSTILPPHEHQLRKLLKLFGLGSRTFGEVTISPPAGNVTIGLFGHPFTLRLVGKAIYLYLRALAPHDHGRPWIRLGPGGLAELVTVNGKPLPKSAKATAPASGEPALAEPPFTGLQKLFAGAKEIRELGAGTLYGQPVARFLAVLEPRALARKSLPPAALKSPALKLPTTTVEVSFAPSGLPLRTTMVTHDAGITTATTLDIPAANFPLVIEAPPADQTISAARLRTLERRVRRLKSKRS
jgi:hypothetical protein